MILLFGLFLIIIFYKSKIDKNNDFLSKEKTTAIKGIFIAFVFFSHFNGYVTYSNNIDIMYLETIRFLGQAMVAPFLFYSGYGIMEQITKKGLSYIKTIPIKRILTTLLKFDIALLFFLVIAIFTKEIISLKQVLLSFIAFDSIGNSNWYIFTILMLYLFTYISFIISNNRKLNLLLITFFSCFYVIILYYFNIKPLFWYDTALCYLLGMYFSYFKKTILNILSNKGIYVLSFIIIFVLFFLLKKYNFFLWTNLLLNLVFCLLILLITMKVSICNKVLLWFGNHLFEIYILQRIPMILLKPLELPLYIYFIGCVFITYCIVLLYKKIADKILFRIIYNK